MQIKSQILASLIGLFSLSSSADLIIDNQTSHRIVASKVASDKGEAYAITIDGKPVVHHLVVVWTLISGAGGNEDAALAQLAQIAAAFPILPIFVTKVTLTQDTNNVCREKGALLARLEVGGGSDLVCLVALNAKFPLYVTSEKR